MKSKFLLLFAACNGCASSTIPKHDKQHYDVVSALQDYKSDKITSNHFVSVSGYLTFGDDKHNLWQDKQTYSYIKTTRPNPDDPAWKQCITLFSYDRFRRKLLRFNGKRVTIAGTITRRVLAPDEIAIGSCSEIGISLQLSEANIMLGKK
jgi:hypothetical protein